MDKTERLEYLKQKRTNYKGRTELEKRQNDLNQFLSELNNIESELVKISSSDINIKNIASPTLYDKPENPVYTELRYKTNEEKLNVKSAIKNWIFEQGSKRILVKNQFLIENNDWLELNAKSLYRNFDLLFEKLNILYTIMLAPENGNFITLFEFEYDVTIYSGIITENGITYYS
ncbi:MAG TPA: hypothetical protein PLL09_03880 [Flavobacterium sp.]|uniref:hypothetical protein n=2 Tax=Flavobacterium TaxID=237 RepID=UPI0025C2D2B9|nr:MULTISPECIES: hypothetical protein [unclassified Flavobacterium]HRE76945.1 hypothetical protein [Flavobacterium sp.]